MLPFVLVTLYVKLHALDEGDQDSAGLGGTLLV